MLLKLARVLFAGRDFLLELRYLQRTEHQTPRHGDWQFCHGSGMAAHSSTSSKLVERARKGKVAHLTLLRCAPLGARLQICDLGVVFLSIRC